MKTSLHRAIINELNMGYNFFNTNKKGVDRVRVYLYSCNRRINYDYILYRIFPMVFFNFYDVLFSSSPYDLVSVLCFILFYQVFRRGKISRAK